MKTLATSSSTLSIEELASQCVLCGICSTTCPTYQITLDENKSPRGRIALIRAVANDTIGLDQHVIEHLDTCLHCFACYTNCPSQVNYPKLIHYGNQLIANSTRARSYKLSSFAELALTNTKIRAISARVLSVLYSVRFIHLVKIFNNLFKSKIVSYLPDTFISINKTHTQTDSTDVTILAGCANNLFASTLLNQSIHLLECLSLSVNTLSNESCCGAINYRKGLTSEPNLKIDKQIHYLSLNASCSAHLNNNYLSSLSEQTLPNKEEFRHTNLETFLHEQQWQKLKQLKFNPLDQKVFLHTSCSQKNSLKKASLSLELIQLIPNIDILQLPQQGCCGASGTYVLDYPKLSNQIVSPYVEIMLKHDIKIMISSDISCALHIKEQLESINHSIEIIHPIGLLSRQLAKI